MHLPLLLIVIVNDVSRTSNTQDNQKYFGNRGNLFHVKSQSRHLGSMSSDSKTVCSVTMACLSSDADFIQTFKYDHVSCVEKQTVDVKRLDKKNSSERSKIIHRMKVKDQRELIKLPEVNNQLSAPRGVRASISVNLSALGHD